MAKIVLIHGGGHGAWCWERVIPLLESHGHQVIAPDLPSLGTDTTPIERVTSETCTARAVDAVKQAGFEVFLVGHSLGGCVISDAAEQIPERVAGLVYITAALVVPGRSFQDLMLLKGLRPQGMRLADDGLSTVVDPALAPHVFYNRTDPLTAAQAVSRLRPNPNALGGSPVKITYERWGRLPRGFIECSDDHLLPIAFQRHMQTNLPCSPVAILDSDHSPFFSAPRELASTLDSWASNWPRQPVEKPSGSVR